MKNITLEAKAFPFERFLIFTDASGVLTVAGEIGERFKLGVYVVGGPIRDFLLDKPVKDLDLVVEGEAEEYARALSRALSGEIKARSPFLTYKIVFPGGELDLATARREVYPRPAVLPKVSPGTIAEDLYRRDFTINAMAVGLSGPFKGKLLDPFGGLPDLKEGLLRVLHPDSFVDDPTRLFRAARYAVRFGFKPARETLEALKRARAKQTLNLLTPARIRGELLRVLSEQAPEKVVEELESLGVLSDLGLPAPPEFLGKSLKIVRDKTSLKLLLKGFILSLTRAEANLSQKLGLSKKEALEFQEEWQKLQRILPELRTASRPSQRFKLLSGFSSPVLIALASVEKDFVERLEEFWVLKTLKPHLSGEDLKAFGIPPGPRMREILQELSYARMDGKVNTREEELTFLGRLLKKG